jgi:DNA-binding transcriptional LysR family regulator
MSAAARALNMPLTTVSRHIAELESTLGVRLLRTTRKLTLTDAGIDYVAAAGGFSKRLNAERQAAGNISSRRAS